MQFILIRTGSSELITQYILGARLFCLGVQLAQFFASTSLFFIETVASGWTPVVSVLYYCLDLGCAVLHLAPLEALILLGLIALSFKLVARLCFRGSGFSLSFWISFALTCIFWYLGSIPPLHPFNLALWRD